MNIRIAIIFFFFLMYLNSFAQFREKENVVGTLIMFESIVLNDEREIQVYLPDNYATSDKQYPVLYILDGQRYFLHAVSLQNTFVEFKETPEFIIVGISKKQSDRNRNFSVNSQKYLEFIEMEIIKYIDSQYRTSGKRMLFGWAFGGGFVISTMIEKPYLFDGLIAASPFPLKDKINKIDSFFTNQQNFKGVLFFSSETNDGLVKSGTSELNRLLINKGKETLNWVFKALDKEEHRSTPFTTLYHGIKKNFDYYPELQFNSLEEFIKAGGIENVYDYYQERALKYGFPKELSDWTMFSLTRNAIRANNYEHFDTLINEFAKTGFITRLRVSRACSIAEFYLVNKQFNKAIKLFVELAGQHPNSERPLNGLGDTYKQMKQIKKANSYYQKALKLSERKPH